jgi:hypothetical protein
MADLEAVEAELRNCPSLPSEGSVYEPGAPPAADPTASTRRFVLLDFIAQGGFATVFRAYDLQRHEYTACKLHRMSDGWANARKEAFVRHVEREMEITVGVRHHRIVDTYAAFEVTSNTVRQAPPSARCAPGAAATDGRRLRRWLGSLARFGLARVGKAWFGSAARQGLLAWPGLACWFGSARRPAASLR